MSPNMCNLCPRSIHLTQREVEVLALLTAGNTNAEIGEQLFISTNTVDRHVHNIFVKIDASNRVEAAAFAIAHGMTQEC